MKQNPVKDANYNLFLWINIIMNIKLRS